MLTNHGSGVKQAALWRPTPRKLREILFREVFGNTETLLGDSPKLLRRETAVGGPSDSGLEEASTGSHIVDTPDLIGYYPVATTDGRTRVGCRQIAPPPTQPTSLSRSDNFAQLREERRRRPDEPCGINSDSAQQIVAPSVTGNEPLPETRCAYSIMMNYAIKTYQSPKRGGLTARNWLRLGCKSEGWAAPPTPPKVVGDNWVAVGSGSEIEIIGGPHVEDSHHVGNPNTGTSLTQQAAGRCAY